MVINMKKLILLSLMALLLAITACTGKPRPPKFETEFEHNSMNDVEIRQAKLQCHKEAEDDSLSYYSRLPLGYCKRNDSLCRMIDEDKRQGEKKFRYKNTRESCLLSFGFKPVKVCVENC